MWISQHVQWTRRSATRLTFVYAWTKYFRSSAVVSSSNCSSKPIQYEKNEKINKLNKCKQKTINLFILHTHISIGLLFSQQNTQTIGIWMHKIPMKQPCVFVWQFGAKKQKMNAAYGETLTWKILYFKYTYTRKRLTSIHITMFVYSYLLAIQWAKTNFRH